MQGQQPPGAAFCHVCGERAVTDGAFCRACGTQLWTAAGPSAGAPPSSYAPPAAYVERQQFRTAVNPPRQGGAGAVWGSIICSLLALGVLPPVLGGIAIYLAVRVRRSRDDLGTALLVVAIACTTVGMVIGAMVGIRAVSG